MAVRTFWFGVAPIALTCAVFLFLVPRPASGATGFLGLVARLGRAEPVPMAVALFFLFAWLARYWRSRLPGTSFLASPPGEQSRRRRALGLVVSVVGAVAAARALRGWFVEWYAVLSPSMLPTLAPGDRIAGNRLAYRPWIRAGGVPPRLPARGDVVVFRSAAVLDRKDGPEFLVKRVVGLPEDVILMHGGVPTINGWLVPTCDAGEYVTVLPSASEGEGEGGMVRGRLVVEYLDGRAYVTLNGPAPPGTPLPYRVQPGEVFVLGDNRPTSVDSRVWAGGRGAGVPLEAIEARAEWFVAGTHRNGDLDFGRLFRPLDALAREVHLEGVDLRPAAEGLARCLKDRPKETTPPPPDSPNPQGA